jgi:drug/metabolite transporter (DMT)-like permease
LLIGLTLFRLSTNVYQVLGIILGFLGIPILVEIDWNTFYINDWAAVGAMILVSISYGLSTQVSKRFLQMLSVYQIAFFTLLIGAVTSGVVAVVVESPNWIAIVEPSVFGSLIGLGSLGTGVAFILLFTLIQKGNAEFASLVTYLVPPFAIMWGYFILNESLSPSLFIGLFFILAGVFLSGRKKRIGKNTMENT